MFIIIADGFRHLYDAEDSISTVETLQDCGSFISQCGLSQDPSSCIIHIKSFNNREFRYTNKCWVVGSCGI